MNLNQLIKITSRSSFKHKTEQKSRYSIAQINFKVIKINSKGTHIMSTKLNIVAKISFIWNQASHEAMIRTIIFLLR